MKFNVINAFPTCAAIVMTACLALVPQNAQAQQTGLSYEQRYCVGMAGVSAGTIEMVQAGGRSWPQIQSELVNIVHQAQWPLSQADFDEAVEIGLIGVRGGDDPRTVAQVIISECMNYAWYAR